MNVLDWILLALIGIAAVRGYAQGIVKELFSVAAPIAGLAAALFLYKWGAGVLTTRFGLTVVPEIVAFAAIFLIAFLLVKILSNILREGLEAAQLAGVDKILGLVLGVFEGFVLVSLILLVIQHQPFFDATALLGESFLGKLLLPIVDPGITKALKSVGPAAELGKEALKAIPAGK